LKAWMCYSRTSGVIIILCNETTRLQHFSVWSQVPWQLNRRVDLMCCKEGCQLSY
jgi:hypothetical protein